MGSRAIMQMGRLTRVGLSAQYIIARLFQYPRSGCRFSNTCPEPAGTAVSFAAAVDVCCLTYCRSRAQYSAAVITAGAGPAGAAAPYSCNTLAAAVSTRLVSYGLRAEQVGAA